ncbi:uncharacterized protein LOC116204986 isoform X1 [Punica granatum]|uniref:Uncharacterized protein LOC116204986 isoform X1 n=1 Tax=Punica granatum TaxID=22663 RepID=A0A6P8DIT7_PUNGR|nr:uncharacterized protein LOC116204986 isoform X1 [Punica granatum]XP_031393251.1 uncharacterized protein LOC116204986 isoform X1 [Punica granatum]
MDEDPFVDIFADAPVRRAPAPSKFQPKARPGPKKGPLAPKPAAVPVKEKEVAPTPSESFRNADSSLSVPADLSSGFLNIEKPTEPSTVGEVLHFKDPGHEHENVECVARWQHEDVVATSTSNIGESQTFGNLTAGIDSRGFDDDENLGDLLPAPSELVGRAGVKFQPKAKARNQVRASGSSAPLPGITDEVPGGNEDWRSDFGKSTEEQNEDILSQLESLDDLLTKSVNREEQTPCYSHEGNEPLTSRSNNVEREGTVLSSEEPITLSSMEIDAEKDSGLPIQNAPDSSHFTEAEVFPGLEAVEVFPDITNSSRGKFKPKPMTRSGAKKPDSGTSQATLTDEDHHQDPLINYRSEYIDDGTVPGSIPEEIFQYSSIGLGESNIRDSTSQPIDDQMWNDHLEPSCFNESVSEEGQRPTISSMDNVDNEGGKKSLRQLRKRTAAHLVDESDGDAQDESFYPNPYSSMDGEIEEGATRDENTLEKKKATGKSKVSKSKNGKPSRKRKGAEEATGQSKEVPKKKFAHTTRRSRRCVDKVLLQTPEEEIDYQKVKIRDLILLAEHKERLAKKSAKASKNPPTGQSVEKAPDGDDSGNIEGSLPTEEGGNSSAQPSESIEPGVILFNYQSFMDRTPSTRWSKQDTELFYEGIRQFGTDLSMIKELFPNLTRRQVKLKFKKEERQNPMRLFEALGSRSKDHKHFEFVIERLQSAAQAEKESKLENSEAMTVEEGSEDSNPETEVCFTLLQGVDEVAKPEKDEEEKGNGDTEGNNGELQSSFKSGEKGEWGEEEDDDDGDDFFSSYKSEL